MSNSHIGFSMMSNKNIFTISHSVLHYFPFQEDAIDSITGVNPEIETGITYGKDGATIYPAYKNYITVSNMQSYDIGYTGNVCGFGNNWESRFGAGMWKTEIIRVYDSPVPGLDRAQRIETYGAGSGGWTSGNIGPTTGDITYGSWIRVWSGSMQFGDLNNANRFYIYADGSTPSTNKFVIPKGKWAWISHPCLGTTTGRHFYAMNATKADILSVMVSDKTTYLPYTNSTVDTITGELKIPITLPETYSMSYWLKNATEKISNNYIIIKNGATTTYYKNGILDASILSNPINFTATHLHETSSGKYIKDLIIFNKELNNNEILLLSQSKNNIYHPNGGVIIK